MTIKFTQTVQINENLSIKSIETATIFMAMELARKSNTSNIVILTDSKSACLSIKNTYINKLDRFYEQKILHMAANNPNKLQDTMDSFPCLMTS